jgi:16S rRNA (cytidine1402-2'-O)-methyltransferase
METLVTGREAGMLHVVSTPIGNMGDFSFRAVETLRSVDLILAEDTRHTRYLLDRYEISTPLLSYHEHNEARATPGLVQRLLAGENFALVSDAGTPLLSDPGARLVNAAAEAGVRISPIPGASAVLAALVAGALPVDRFTFFGFLPRTGSARREAVAEVVSSRHTAVLYESPARVADTLGDLAGAGAGARHCALARELTKQHEEVRRGTVQELLAYYSEVDARGEIVIVLEGAPERVVDEETVRARVQALLAGGLSARDAAATAAVELGVSRRLTYRMALE